MLMLAGGHGGMTETLYLDLFFLVNLSADLYLLFLTGLVLREPVKKRKGRLILGAAAGTCPNHSNFKKSIIFRRI